MNNGIDIVREYEIRGTIEAPYLEYFNMSSSDGKMIANNVHQRTSEDLMLISKAGYCVEAVFAGLKTEHMEYFAKHAPMEYKLELMEIFKDQDGMNGVWEIAKAMDEDAGDGSTKNQERVKNVIQYIQDNRVVFQT